MHHDTELQDKASVNPAAVEQGKVSDPVLAIKTYNINLCQNILVHSPLKIEIK